MITLPRAIWFGIAIVSLVLLFAQDFSGVSPAIGFMVRGICIVTLAVVAIDFYRRQRSA